jgi:hypothetical protein
LSPLGELKTSLAHNPYFCAIAKAKALHALAPGLRTLNGQHQSASSLRLAHPDRTMLKQKVLKVHPNDVTPKHESFRQKALHSTPFQFACLPQHSFSLALKTHSWALLL